MNNWCSLMKLDSNIRTHSVDMLTCTMKLHFAGFLSF
ncbi:hypothetical protein Ccrd_014589 [Cynara cardunculus var. scolymus]|uniref:Uncharacterized protein n=1 Tax=Cynara cardunculus var. scolymus TaxID=59895 RepID=A0A103YDE6_CYNCS|nr:hypothetical protein Ccrd_014589 [Cynara cardunculus var. scolymus]